MAPHRALCHVSHCHITFGETLLSVNWSELWNSLPWKCYRFSTFKALQPLVMLPFFFIMLVLHFQTSCICCPCVVSRGWKGKMSHTNSSISYAKFKLSLYVLWAWNLVSCFLPPLCDGLHFHCQTPSLSLITVYYLIKTEMLQNTIIIK